METKVPIVATDTPNKPADRSVGEKNLKSFMLIYSFGNYYKY